VIAATGNRAARSTAAWLYLLLLLLRKEVTSTLATVANSVLLPICICYSAFMVSPTNIDVQRTWAIGGLVVGMGMTCLTQVSFAVATDRLRGGMRLIATLPVSARAYIASHLTYGVMLGLLVAGSGAVFLRISGLTAVSWDALPQLIFVAALSGLSLACIGVAIGIWTPDVATADTVVSSAGLVLAIVSPVFYPLSALPSYLRPIGWLSPYTHIASLASDIANARPLSLAHLSALAAIAAGALFSTMLLYRRGTTR